METLKQKQLRILTETASAYIKDTRSITSGGQCVYFKEGTQGCAVGRLIADKELCKKLDAKFDENGKLNTTTSAKGVFDRLPQDVQELGVEFLTRLQGLHDDLNERYWDDLGLTEDGKVYVESIKRTFELN